MKIGTRNSLYIKNKNDKKFFFFFSKYLKINEKTHCSTNQDIVLHTTS